MNKRDQIEAQYPESKMLFIPDMDEAILGVDTNQWTKESDKDDDSKERVIYSVRKLMQIFMERDGMDYETAREHMEYNVMGGYVGVHTPVFAEDEELSEEFIQNQGDIIEAWNELEELDTNFNELSGEELKELRDTLQERIKKALNLLAKYVPDTFGEK